MTMDNKSQPQPEKRLEEIRKRRVQLRSLPGEAPCKDVYNAAQLDFQRHVLADIDYLLSLLQQPTSGRCEVSVTGKHRVDAYCKDCGQQFRVTGAGEKAERKTLHYWTPNGRGGCVHCDLDALAHPETPKHNLPAATAAEDGRVAATLGVSAPTSAPVAPQDGIPWEAIQNRAGTDVMSIAMDSKSGRLTASGLMEAIANYAQAAYETGREEPPSTTTTSDPAIEAARMIAKYVDGAIPLPFAPRLLDDDIAAIISKHLDAGEVERLPSRDEAIKYLESIGAQTDSERVLLAQFLATEPTVQQVFLCTSLVLQRELTAIKQCIDYLRERGRMMSSADAPLWYDACAAALQSLLDKPDAAQKGNK